MRMMIGKGGGHYHSPDCKMVDRSAMTEDVPLYGYDYYEVDIAEGVVKKGKEITIGRRVYRPCPLCQGRRRH